MVAAVLSACVIAHPADDMNELQWGLRMRRLTVALGFVLCALLVASCAATQAPDGVLPPQAQIACQPGFYFCHGEVAGCCPNGWGCASTHCIRPQVKNPRKVQDRSCQPGFYFCPGEVPGCCPNGWGCASTHCVRPPKRVDL
jgi:hypothetical protein